MRTTGPGSRRGGHYFCDRRLAARAADRSSGNGNSSADRASRMAVINPKDKTGLTYIEDWKAAARKLFNTIRIFDAQRATYAERIELLESLKMIDPDWQAALTYVIDAFKQDWAQRLAETANIIIGLVENAAGHSVKKNCRDAEQMDLVKQELANIYQ